MTQSWDQGASTSQPEANSGMYNEVNRWFSEDAPAVSG